MFPFPGRARALLREPLLHFLVAGAVLFAWHRAAARPPEGHIVVPASFAAALREDHKERTGRPPTDEEARALLDRFVDEEVLYREALAQGLDRGDLIVRRRLLQKMELLARASVPEPTDSDLAAHLAAHQDRYRAADTLTFRHVFLSRDRHGPDTSARARALLAALRSGEDPVTLGDPFVLGASFTRRTRADIESSFGAPFAAAALAAPQGEWTGPIPSTFGEHLVRVDARSGGRPPDLADVRPRVREDWLREHRESALRTAIDRLRARYSIDIEPLPR